MSAYFRRDPLPKLTDTASFHNYLGPVLMISYALLSNTLLLTVLVAILGNTFATINADAAAEVRLDEGIRMVS